MTDEKGMDGAGYPEKSTPYYHFISLHNELVTHFFIVSLNTDMPHKYPKKTTKNTGKYEKRGSTIL